MNALSRKKDYRNNVVRNLATSLVLYEKIKTTKAKAKAIKPVVEHLISLAKKNDLTAKRRLNAYLFDENATKKMFEVLLPRYKNINSGFIKSYNLGPRQGDNAEMVLLELASSEKEKVSATIEPKVESKIVEGKDASKEKPIEKPAKAKAESPKPKAARKTK